MYPALRKKNTWVGWLVFIIAATTYILTVEPTSSLWDCGEFIATSYKLQVGHPPGAPFFMLLARFFSIFAGSNYELVARLINYMSALASAFTILFLFWTITHIAYKILVSRKTNLDIADEIIILGSGILGALAYTFSDTFWFSAVEAEVYAMSSLFTAVVFWAILRWEDSFDQKFNLRWIVLIAYLMGLSIGVHLLNLLAIPAIVMVYYFKKYPFSWKGFFSAFVVSIGILAFIMYGLIQGLVVIASKFELVFVNSFGFPYNSGIIFFLLILIGSLIYGITYANRKQKKWLQLAVTSIAMILIGYSSYALIVIRASANTPINENRPDNVFSLLSYLDREQYGDRPLIYGQYYNAPVVEVNQGKARYAPLNGKYEIIGYDYDVVYDKRFTTFFPRMYSPDPNHIKVYHSWANIKGRPVEITENGKTRVEYVPTFGENLRFFFKYQVGHMYMRYFLWNFVGRQNDEDGSGILSGNWISGISFIDEKLVGNQHNLPASLKNAPSRNTYYFLPFILGLIGLLFLLDRSKSYFTITVLLFFFTGLAIVIYLNQTPLQPRERDYAYAGSFYAFAIWIGLGVMSLFEMIKSNKLRVTRAILTVLVCVIAVPSVLAYQNWDDHDRSGRYTTRSFAYNYLQSCAPNAILFTYGDNDTFPLWYLQEVEGIRTDVRVVNTMLLNSDWYIDQMKYKVYKSDPLPISLNYNQYIEGKRNRIYLLNEIKEPIDLFQALEFVASENPQTKTIPGYDERIDFIPGRNFYLTVDKNAVLLHNNVGVKDAHLIEDTIYINAQTSSLTKSQYIMLDIIAHNHWKRPIYFASAYSEGTCWLNDYLQLDGFAYRLIPIRTPYNNQTNAGRINTDTLYRNLMEKFDYGHMEKPNVYLDNFHKRTFSILRFRNTFARLAMALIQENKKDSALKVLDRCIYLLPFTKMSHDVSTLELANAYALAGNTDKAKDLLNDFANQSIEYLNYFAGLSSGLKSLCEYDINLNMYQLQQVLQLQHNLKMPENKQLIEEMIRFKNIFYQ